MPTISLRLTEEQHAALKRWAHDDARSVQKEIIFRLFSPYVVHAESDKERAKLAYPAAGLSGVDERGSKRPTVEPPAADSHFKPDFKK